MSYPQDQWETSAHQMQRALRDDPFFTMDAHRTNRIVNASKDYDELNEATKRAHRQRASYVLVSSSVLSPDNVFNGTRDYVQLPIGEYGEEAAAKLARLTISLKISLKDLR